eukprot:5644667-Pleurochrysis_carterae.AAC.3
MTHSPALLVAPAVFGHINNVMYYAYMDDAVNAHLLDNGVGVNYARMVLQSGCRYMQPISYPCIIDVGLRISKLGRSTATYDIGLFQAGVDAYAAQGTYTHCYVDASGRPVSIHPNARAVLSVLLPPDEN